MTDNRTKWPKLQRARREVELVWAKINGTLARQTPNAIAFITDTRTIWLPKSQAFAIEYDQGGDGIEIRVGRRVRSVEIPRWLAEQKDLDYESPD